MTAKQDVKAILQDAGIARIAQGRTAAYAQDEPVFSVSSPSAERRKDDKGPSQDESTLSGRQCLRKQDRQDALGTLQDGARDDMLRTVSTG